MAQVPVNKEYNTFVKGLITEAGPLTFPENASLDELNFKLNRKGYRSRRLGMDFENDFSLIDSVYSSGTAYSQATAVFKWGDVNNDGNLTIIVVQMGSAFYFFDGNAQPISGSPLNGGNYVYIIGANSSPIQSAVISGDLVLTYGGRTVWRFSYDESSDEITTYAHAILVRDIWGVSESIKDTSRVLDVNNTDAHRYNLYNQGWGATDPEGGVPYSHKFFNDKGIWPSNADTPTSGVDTTDKNKFNSDLVTRAIQGDTPAPKGSFIIDLMSRGWTRGYAYSGNSLLDNFGYDDGWSEYYNDTVAGDYIYGAFDQLSRVIMLPPTTLDIPQDLDRAGPTCVASYAGRVFYAGFKSTLNDSDSKSPNLGTVIAYSQVVNNPENIGKCYQQGDPTSYTNFDLVDSDGGIITIPGASGVVKLVSYGKSLIVFAKNGVWEIRGEEGSFSATSNAVDKISDIGAISPRAVIQTEDKLIYWAISGIYVIGRDSTGFGLSQQSLTENTIQSFYTNLPTYSKVYSVGVYDAEEHVISWLYNDNEDFDEEQDYTTYNKQLNFDTSLGAFYIYGYAEDSEDPVYPYVSDMFISPAFTSGTHEEVVAVGGEVVQVDGDNVVITERSLSSTPTRATYFLVTPAYGEELHRFTFGSIKNPEFLDWEASGSTAKDAPAHLETGYEIAEDTQRMKQATYITTHMQRTESGFDIDLNPVNPSSCLVTAKWDFANSNNSGKIGQQFQAYRLRRDYTPSGPADSFDYGQSVISVKSKLRGRGRALTLTFNSEPGKDCILYGWGSTYLGATDV